MSEFAGIEAFVHTAEQRSFRRAAERLRVTPAAVSKAVARLEERLGVLLLERSSRKVTLTAEGTSYLRHCRAALDTLSAGRDTVSQHAGTAQGPLRVTLPFILGPQIAAALPRLAARHPRLVFDIRASDRYVNLLEEDVDVALRIGHLDDSPLVARRLRVPRWVTAASPAYLARHGAPRVPDDLRAHACLKFATAGSAAASHGGVVEWRFARAPGGVGEPLKLATQHTIDHGELLVLAAAAGLGVVQAFDFLVEPDLAAGRLVEILPAYAAAGPPIHALCRPQRQSTPNVRAFLDFVGELLGAPR
jgi:LysR family transcriptional regulator for bpeEF and oprC